MQHTLLLGYATIIMLTFIELATGLPCSGCAIYTGKETKISLNSRYASHKFSRVER
jgi:hypothetical protein